MHLHALQTFPTRLPTLPHLPTGWTGMAATLPATFTGWAGVNQDAYMLVCCPTYGWLDGLVHACTRFAHRTGTACLVPLHTALPVHAYPCPCRYHTFNLTRTLPRPPHFLQRHSPPYPYYDSLVVLYSPHYRYLLPCLPSVPWFLPVPLPLPTHPPPGLPHTTWAYIVYSHLVDSWVYHHLPDTPTLPPCISAHLLYQPAAVRLPFLPFCLGHFCTRG